MCHLYLRISAVFLATLLAATPAISDDDPNVLMGEAINLYSSAIVAEGEERRGLFTEVDAILKRIETEFPDSVPAAMLAEGRSLGPIDRDFVVSELTVRAPSLVETLSGDLAAKWAILENNSPDVAAVVEDTLREAIASGQDEAVEELYIKTSYYVMAAFYYVSNSPLSQYFDPTEAGELYKAFVTGRGLDQVQTIGIESLESIAAGIALDFGTTALTNIIVDKGLQLTGTPQTIVKAAVKASMTELVLALQASKNPTKVPELVFKRLAELVEIVVTTRGLAADVDRAMIATAMEMQTLAQITAAYRDQEGTQNAINATRLNLEDRMVGAVGRDDAEAVSKIFLLGWAALTAEFEGDEARVEALHDLLLERGNVSNIPTLWNPPDLLTYLANGFEDSPRRAAKFMISLTALSKYSGNEAELDRVSTANSTAALPPELQGLQVAPDGFLGPDRIGASSGASAECTEPFEIVAGQTACGLSLSDVSEIAHQTGFRSAPIRVSASSDGTEYFAQLLRVSPAPNGTRFFIKACEGEGGLCWRDFVLDLTEGSLASVPNVETYGARIDAIWSADSTRFAVTFGSEGVTTLALFEADFSGFAVWPPVEQQGPDYLYALIDEDSLVFTSPTTLTANLSECTGRDISACQSAFTSRAPHAIRLQNGTLVVEPLSVAQPVPVDADGTPLLFDHLTAGVYNRTSDNCSVAPINNGDGRAGDFIVVRTPEVSFSHERICTVSHATPQGQAVQVAASCAEEGEFYDRQFRWRILSETSFLNLDARGGPAEYSLCTADSVAQDPAREWTADIVHVGGYGRPDLTACLFDADSGRSTADCLRDDGASTETIRFAEVRAREGGEGPEVPVSFKELGKVDIAFLDSFAMSQNEWEYFVNTSPETISAPMYPERDLARLAAQGDRRARAILRQFPGATAWKPFVGGMRRLPNGHQRFSTVVYWTENCRACPIVGYNIATVDFDQNGRFRAYETRGVFDNRRHAKFMGMTADDLRRDSAAVQFYLNIRGYNAGPMDGAIGPRTRTALADFQRENAINSGTGQLDSATLEALANYRTLFENGTGTGATAPRSPTVQSPGAAFLAQCQVDGETLNTGGLIFNLVDKPLKGRTVAGSDWSLFLRDDRPSNFGAATFTNAAGTTSRGQWFSGGMGGGKVGLCQRYSTGSDAVCHEILPCRTDPTQTFAMRNADGEISSIVTTRDSLGATAAGAPGAADFVRDIALSWGGNPQGITGSFTVEGRLQPDGLMLTLISATGRHNPGARFNPVDAGSAFRLALSAAPRRLCDGCTPDEVFISGFGLTYENNLLRPPSSPMSLLVPQAHLDANDVIGIGLRGTNDKIYLTTTDLNIAALLRNYSGASPPSAAETERGVPGKYESPWEYMDWVQVTSRPTLREARDVARQYSAAFPKTQVFKASNGWFAIVVDYIDDHFDNRQRLANYVAEGRVPVDVILTKGASFVERFSPGADMPLPAPEFVYATVLRSTRVGGETQADGTRYEGDEVLRTGAEVGVANRYNNDCNLSRHGLAIVPCSDLSGVDNLPDGARNVASDGTAPAPQPALETTATARPATNVEDALRSGKWKVEMVTEEILRGLLIAKGMIEEEVDTTGMNQFQARRAVEDSKRAGLNSWSGYEQENITISFSAIPTRVSWDGFYFQNNEYIACLPSGVKFGDLELKLQIDHALDTIWYHNSGLGPQLCESTANSEGGPRYLFAFRGADPLRVIVHDEAQAEGVYERYRSARPYLRFDCDVTEYWFDSVTCRIQKIELAIGSADSLTTIYGVSRDGYYWQ
ncbi:MAG: peptidoglycan-binding domain-containing protein [Pseudomonadota bacterium]